MRKPKKGQSLAEKYPEVAAQWHPTKNGELTPFDFSCGSNRKVWWKCENGDDHVWYTYIYSRSLNGNGCPICTGYKAIESNSLATTHPKIAKEWHPTKNGELIPSNIRAGSHKKVWWKCEEGVGHEWESMVYNRKSGHGCPFCTNQKVILANSLATTHPEIAEEWHPTKNGTVSPEKILGGSDKKIWWKCSEGDDHVWQARVANRTSHNRNCPICSGQKTVMSNCLATTHPKIARQWHPMKNLDLTPYDVTIGSKINVWWKCDTDDDHEWTAPIVERLRRHCKICFGRKIVLSNCLATTHPKLASQWHPTKNKNLTVYDVKFGSSSQKAWWKCDKDPTHVWRATVGNRCKGQSCPFCNLTPQSKQELTITFELLKLFPDINPRGFKSRLEDKIWSIDIYIPLLHLGVEFDGSYWHKDKVALDKLKTKKLKSEGFNILRVREEPLKRISDSDIISKQPFNAKEVTNNILTHIMSNFELEDVLVKKIKAYISKKKLQNEKGLDEYIEMILTEKAEKD